MRVESFQLNRQMPKSSKWLEGFLIGLYAFTLKLYPQSFKAAFADEMLDVFTMSLRNAGSSWGMFKIASLEALEFPMNLLRQSMPNLNEPQNLWRARQVTRLSSLALNLFFAYSLITHPQNLSAEGIAFFILIGFTLLSMLLAWRWEQLGGLSTMGCGMALGFFLIFYIARFRPVEVSFIGLTLVGTLWALPFVTLGAMFYQLSNRPVPQEVKA